MLAIFETQCFAATIPIFFACLGQILESIMGCSPHVGCYDLSVTEAKPPRYHTQRGGGSVTEALELM